MSLMVQYHIHLITEEVFVSRLAEWGLTLATVDHKLGHTLSQVIQHYHVELMTSTIHSFETYFAQVSGIPDEFSIFVIEYIRESYINGPDFEVLRRRMIERFAEYDLESHVEFFTFLENIFRHSIADGFSSFVKTIPNSATDEDKHDETEGTAEESSSTVEIKSMTLMSFSDVTMSSAY